MSTGPDGVRAALGEAVAAAAPPALQPQLFGAEETQPAPIAPANPGGKAGRPVGARNRRTEDYAAFLKAKHGDPLDVATAIAARDVTAPGALAELARELGMERGAAAEFWLRTLTAVLPYLHQKMPQAIHLTPGAPGGGRVVIDGDDATDITPALAPGDESAAA